MKYWIGAALGAAAIYFFLAARAHKARIIDARAAAIRAGRSVEKPIVPNSIAALGEMVTPIVLFALVYTGLKVSFAYYVLNNGVLSIVDLAGTLLLLAAYGVWLRAKTHYRLPPLGIEEPARDPVVAEISAAVTRAPIAPPRSLPIPTPVHALAAVNAARAAPSPYAAETSP